ncbi:MAG TPA: polysaccharide deacetylase family protein [Paludibacter sp.]|nr:polysaccharide deacetylase family protein [Paludibacter sp.]
MKKNNKKDGRLRVSGHNKFIISSIILCSFLVLSCNSGNQKQSNSKSQTNAVVKDSVALEKNSTEQILAKPQVPVICFHRIANGRNDEYTVSPATFTSQIKTLSDSGFHSILPDQLYDYLVYNKTLPDKPFVITFDDSRVEHAEIAAPILEQYGFRGAFFIMTITYNKKNYMKTEQIAQLAQAGHTIGMHSWDHTMITKYKEPADWEKQVIEPRKKLESITGTNVSYWAHPYGIFNHESVMGLSQYFKLSFSLSTKRDSLMPLQTVRRIIATEGSPQGLIRSMRKSFD